MWLRTVSVRNASEVRDLTGWTILYVAGLVFSGNDTDSSSTS